MNKPVEKYEGKGQTTGEVEYVNDGKLTTDHLHAAMVYSDHANCEIKSVNSVPALKMKGVVAYLDHKDVPGLNAGYVSMFGGEPEELFCTGKVKYAGQPVGMIVATDTDTALKASK